jgi:hypothetical protein
MDADQLRQHLAARPACPWPVLQDIIAEQLGFSTSEGGVDVKGFRDKLKQVARGFHPNWKLNHSMRYRHKGKLVWPFVCFLNADGSNHKNSTNVVGMGRLLEMIDQRSNLVAEYLRGGDAAGEGAIGAGRTCQYEHVRVVRPAC